METTSKTQVNLCHKSTFTDLWPTERVVMDPNVMGGTPVFRGTRIPVSLIVSLLAAGHSEDEIVRQYEGRLEQEDVQIARKMRWLYVETRTQGTHFYRATRRASEFSACASSEYSVASTS